MSEIENGEIHSVDSAVKRVRDYPVVKDCCEKAGEYLAWVKAGRLGGAISWTESLVTDAVSIVEPIAGHHLDPLNKYVCTKLDNLENNYPIVKESSEEVLKATSQYYESNIKSKVESATAYAVGTPYRITTQTIEMLSSTANNFVNSYMNPTPVKNAQEGSQEIVPQSHDDTFKRAITEVNMIRSYTTDNVQKLTSLLSSIYNKTVVSNEEWIRKYYEEFQTEINSKNTAPSPEVDTNSKLMSLALTLSNKVRISVRAMSTVCYSHLSPDYQEKLDLVFAKTEQLYNNINMSTYDTIREKISMENVHWIGQTASIIMNNVKDNVEQKYNDYKSKDIPVKNSNAEIHDCEVEDKNTTDKE